MVQNKQTYLTGQDASDVHAMFSDHHADVDLTDTPADGDVITWREQSGKFVLSAPLTGWETDVDGNLVMTGDGGIKGSAAHGLILRGGFLDGGPPTQEEGGYVLRVYDDNFDYGSEPSEHLAFYIDGYNSTAGMTGYALNIRTSASIGRLRVQTTDGIGGTIEGTESGPDGLLKLLANGATQSSVTMESATGIVTIRAQDSLWTFTADGQLTPPVVNPINAAASDAASTQALANNIRLILLDLGMVSAA